MIERFGLEDPGEAWHQAGPEDLVEVVEAMLGSGAWTNPGIALMTLAAGLRPALPRRYRTSMFLSGVYRAVMIVPSRGRLRIRRLTYVRP